MEYIFFTVRGELYIDVNNGGTAFGGDLKSGYYSDYRQKYQFGPLRELIRKEFGEHRNNLGIIVVYRAVFLELKKSIEAAVK